MSDYIHIEKEYFRIMDLDPIIIGKEKLKVGTDEVVMLSKIISMSQTDKEWANTNHACRCSNKYFMDLINKKEKTIQRTLRTLKENELIYVYEYKAESFLTTQRYIFPNWKKINEVCGTKLEIFEIPEYVIQNRIRVKSDPKTIEDRSNLTLGQVKSDTLIIDSNRLKVLDIPSETSSKLSDEVNSGIKNMQLDTNQKLFAYMKYGKKADKYEDKIVTVYINAKNHMKEFEIEGYLLNENFSINDINVSTKQFLDDYNKFLIEVADEEKCIKESEDFNKQSEEIMAEKNRENFTDYSQYDDEQLEDMMQHQGWDMNPEDLFG